MSTTEAISLIPQCQAEREAISAQVEKIVSHSLFRSSRRCSALLRYITEKQLEEQTRQIKERMIGVNLFGRSADYDTGADPVVRTAANDLRKRLAQYYQEPGHENELRIAIPIGCYRPEFHAPYARNGSTLDCTPDEAATPALPLARISGVTKSRLKGSSRVICACLLLAVFLAVAWKRSTRPPRSLDEFWAPVAGSRTLVCVGTWSLSSVTPEGSAKPEMDLDFHDLLPITDAVAFSRVVAFLGQTHVPFQIESAKATTLSDLTQAPVIFVGAFDNYWTMRITDPLRFHFVQSMQSDGRIRPVIEDRKNAERKFVDGAGDMPGSTKEYAIVGRLFDKGSGQIAVLVAGMGAAGTTAASEFITSSRYVDDLAKQVPKSLSTKNVEAVISVQVVDSRPGAPRLETVETW